MILFLRPCYTYFIVLLFLWSWRHQTQTFYYQYNFYDHETVEGGIFYDFLFYDYDMFNIWEPLRFLYFYDFIWRYMRTFTISIFLRLYCFYSSDVIRLKIFTPILFLGSQDTDWYIYTTVLLIISWNLLYSLFYFMSDVNIIKIFYGCPIFKFYDFFITEMII